MAYRCKLCQDTQWFRHDVPVSHKDFGKAFPCDCKIAETQGYGQAQKLRSAQDQDKIANSQRDWTLGNFPGDDVARHWAEQAFSAKRGIWIFWSDAFGLGKTGLLIAVVNACIDSGIPAFYNNAPRMLDELRAGYRNDTYDDKMNQLIQAPVLAIDEFHRVYDKGGGGNAEGSSSWAAEHIFTIVDERYTFADERMTLIATNRNPTSGDDPISSRFSDNKRCHIVSLTGKDMRKHGTMDTRKSNTTLIQDLE